MRGQPPAGTQDVVLQPARAAAGRTNARQSAPITAVLAVFGEISMSTSWSAGRVRAPIWAQLLHPAMRVSFQPALLCGRSRPALDAKFPAQTPRNPATPPISNFGQQSMLFASVRAPDPTAICACPASASLDFGASSTSADAAHLHRRCLTCLQPMTMTCASLAFAWPSFGRDLRLDLKCTTQLQCARV